MSDLSKRPEEPDLASGTLLERLSVTDLTVEGKAVARNNGHVVFLDTGLPGEILSARIVKTMQRVIHARVECCLQQSPHAVDSWCRHVSECGACLWQHFSLQAAREWKQKHVQEILTRIAKVAEPKVFSLVPAPSEREYRNKMSFAFAPNTDPHATQKTLLGLRKYKERTVVEVTDCGMQPPVVMQLLTYVRKQITSLGLEAWQGNRAGYLRFLVVHTPLYMPQDKKQIVVECITGVEPEQPDKGRYGETRKKFSEADKVRHLGLALVKEFGLTGFIHSQRSKFSDVAQGERVVFLAGSDEYQERFGHIVLTVPHTVFLQTNSAVAEQLYAGVQEEAGLTGQETVWDLYSGMGSISLYLAAQAREVHAVESQADAVDAARKNSARHGYAHCYFHHSMLTPPLLASLPQADVIVADPPRAGIDENICRFLNTSPARRLIYISCDPGTQARDIARLASAWEMRHSRPYDMFPYTPHIENIAVLDRRTL